MPKLYFVVDYPGSGGVEVIVNLLEILREKNIVGTAIRLGGPGSIANSGTKLPDGTLNNIDNAIIEQSAADAIVFEGWKITDHVNEIFDSYSGACFLFVKSVSNNTGYNSKIKTFEKYVTAEDLSTIVATQKIIIEEFVQNKYPNLTWTTVGSPMFTNALELNVADVGNYQVGIIGTL